MSNEEEDEHRFPSENLLSSSIQRKATATFNEETARPPASSVEDRSKFFSLPNSGGLHAQAAKRSGSKPDLPTYKQVAGSPSSYGTADPEDPMGGKLPSGAMTTPLIKGMGTRAKKSSGNLSDHIRVMSQFHNEEHDSPDYMPFLILQNVVQQSGDFYGSYKSTVKVNSAYQFLLVLIGCLFEVGMPYMIGYFIKIQILYNNGQLQDGEREEYQLNILYGLLSLSLISSLAEKLRVSSTHRTATTLTNHMRYDVYFMQMKKIRKIIDEFKFKNKIDKFTPIDVSKHVSEEYEVKFDKKFADFHYIDQSIEVFYDDYSEISSKNIRSKFMMFTALAFMLLVSWHLSALCIGAMFLLWTFKMYSDSRVQSRRSQEGKVKEDLFCNAEDHLREIKLNDEEYHKIQLDFKKKTTVLINHQSQTIFLLSGFLFLQLILAFSFRSGVFYYARYLYAQAVAQIEDEDFFDLGPFKVNLIFAFFLYFEELIRHYFNYKALKMGEHQKKLRRAEDELFSIVKLQPHIGTKGTSKDDPFTISKKGGPAPGAAPGGGATGGAQNAGAAAQKVGNMVHSEYSQAMMETYGHKSEFQDFMGSHFNSLMPVVEGEFMGAKIFCGWTSRRELPHKKLDEPVPFWKIISKFIGQDLTRVSLPVILNEPLSALQRISESLIIGTDLFEMASFSEDPGRRLSLVFAGLASGYWTFKMRKRKPFNPMLGETYEMVTDKFRLLAEKVEHLPKQIICFELEGEHYRLNSYSQPKPNFKFNGGRGMMEITQIGAFDCHFKKFDEHVSISKPKVLAKNLIIGQFTMDLEGVTLGKNHTTGHTFEMKFLQQKGKNMSRIEGKCFDRNGTQVYELTGSWMNEMVLTNLKTGVTEVVWKEPSLLADAHMQYFFNPISVNLNYLSPEMEGALPCTDCRFRGDMRRYEEGKIDEADAVKLTIEEQQRKVRKEVEEGKQQPWEPRFFRKVPHAHLTERTELNTNEQEDPPIAFELITGEKGYWERRKRADWADMPNLWGPFD